MGLSSLGFGLFAEVHRPNFRVVTDFLGCTGEQNLAVDQHAYAVSQREHRIHVVLDHQDGVLPLQSLKPRNDGGGLLTAHSGHMTSSPQEAQAMRPRSVRYR